MSDINVSVGYIMEGQGALHAGLDSTNTKISRIGDAAEKAGEVTTRVMGNMAKATDVATASVDSHTRSVKAYADALKAIPHDATAKERSDAIDAARKLQTTTAMPPAENTSLVKWREDLVKIGTEIRGVTALMQQFLDVAKALSAIKQQPEMFMAVADVKAITATVNAMAKAAAELKNYDSVARAQIATDKELISVKQRLNDLQGKQAARQDPGYQKEVAELQKLTRAEMEKVAVDKLIDKLYQDRARVIAFSSDAYKQEAAGLAKLTMEERVAAETAKQLEIQQQRVAKAMALTDPAVRELIKDYNKLAAETRAATASTERFNLHAAGLNNITAGLRAALAGVGMGFGIYTSATIVAASATFAFVSAVKSMVITTSEFTGEMASISAVMGTTEAQFEAVKQRSLELGASTRYSATEVASAFREMGMSGMSFQESMQGVTAVLSLASIGNMDFFQATDIATNVLFGFGMAATDLTHVVDVMAKTVTSSNQDIKQLGNAMSYAAPIASSFGLSLEMAASMTEVLANAGIKASRAGTTLRRTLTALFSDSENVNKELGELGVTVNTLAQDADRELLRVLNELNKATNGATTGVGNLIKAVGLYAAPGFLKLVASANEATGSLQEVYKATQDVAGAAYEMQKRIEDFIGVDWETVKSAGESLSLAFGELYIKALREATQETAAWLQGLADSKKAVLQLAEAVEILGMAVGGAVVAFIGLGAVKYVIGALMGVRAAWSGVETATLAATAATKWYGKAALFAFRSLQMVAGFAILATAIWAVVEAYKAFTNVKKEALKGDLNLANANKVLAPAFDGDRQISKYSEAEAARTADIKRGLEDLYKQRDTLEESIYVQQRLTEAGKETGAAIARLTLEQDKLNKAIAESEKAFRATMADLLKADEARLQGRKPVLEMEITIAQESLTKAEATVADIQERMRLRLKEVTRPLPGESRSNWAVYRRNTRADRFRNESGEWRSMTEELTTAEDALQLINDSLAKKRDELRELLARLGQIAVEAFVLQVPISVEAVWQLNQASVTQLNREIDELLATRGKAMKEAELQEAKKLPDRAKEPVNRKQIDAWDQEFAAIVGLGEAMAIMRTQRDLLKEQAKRGENAPGLEELTTAIDLYEKRVGAFVAMGDSMGKAYKSQAEISQRAANDIDTLNAKIAEGIKANDEALRHAVENTKAPADQLDEVLKRMAEYQTKWHAMAQRQAALKDVLKEGGQENAEANLAEAAALELLSVAVTDHGKDIADYTRLRKELAKEYEKSLAGMDKLAEAEDDLAARIRNKGEALDKDRSQMVSTIVEYNALKDSVDAGRDAYAEAQTALAELTRQGIRSGAQWETANQVISEQERRMAAVKLLTDAYGDSVKELGDKLLEAARAQKKYQDEVVAGEADLQKMIDDRTRAKLPLGEQRAMLVAQSMELREQLDAIKADIAAMLAAYQELERLGQTPLINTGMANLQFALAASGKDAAALVGRLKDSQTDLKQVESDTESLANSNETLAKSYREAKQALDEFLNAPQEWNFPDTLKGQTDLLLAQAQAVLDELKGINREMDTLEVTGESYYNTKIGGYSRVSRHRGSTDPGTAFGGYTSLSVSNAEYAAQAAKSLGLNSAQTSMLNKSIDLITERAKALNLNRDAVLALITAESSWNPGNVSPAGAVGLMQLMPGTAKGIGEAIGVDYEKAISGQKGWNENILIGTQYLANITEQRSGLNAVLAEYNGGDKGAKYYERTGKFFTETAAFVPTVRGLMEDIQKGSASWEEFGTAGAAAVAQVDAAAQAATSPAEAVSGAAREDLERIATLQENLKYNQEQMAKAGNDPVYKSALKDAIEYDLGEIEKLQQKAKSATESVGETATAAATAPAASLERLDAAVAAVSSVDTSTLDNINAALQTTSMSTLALADGLVDIPPAVGEMANAVGHVNDATTVFGDSAESMSVRSVGLVDATSALSISYDQLAVTTGLSETAFDSLGISFDGVVERSNALAGPTVAVSTALDEVTASAATADEQLAKEGATAREAASYHEDLGKRLMADKEAYEALTVTGEDYRKLTDMQTKTLAQLFIETEKLKKIRDEMGKDGMDERELDMINQRKEAIERLAAIYKAEQAQRAKVWEELVASGKTGGLVPFKYDKDQLQSLSDGYDSVTTRTRAFRVEMERIQQLEDGGYLSKSEAALAKIDARFENLDPLTKDVATNIMDALKNVATGASTGKEAMDSLQESLVDIAMEKYVVKIGLDIVGQIMDPFLVAFQNIAMSMLSGLGDILASGISSLFSSGSGTGTGGTSGTGIMDTISKVFNGNSIGKGIADALMKSGFGTQIGESAGYEITSSMSGWTSGIANTPNWAYGAGSILGSMAGNAIFKGKGYSGIGSSIGAMAGSIGGAAFGGSAAGTAALAALGISTGGVGLIVAAIVGGLLGGVVGGGLGSLFGNVEPRPGAYAAITHGGTGMLEDNVGSKGAFGLTFGMSDIGTKGLDANEMKETFDGFAKVSEVLAEFYGKDVSAMVEESLKAISAEGYSKNGILRYAMDVNEAFDVAFTQIIDAAAATGDDMAVLLKATVGDLYGTVENMASQIEAGMATAKAAMGLAKAFAGQDIADKLQLSDKLVDSALTIIHYSHTIQKSGETAAEAMARLALDLAGLESALEITGTETAAVGQAFVDLSVKLEDAAKAAGIAIGDLITLQAFYFENFYSASEKAVKAITQTMNTLKEEFPKLKEKLLGINAPDKIKIEIPELKDTMKAASGDGGSSALYAYLREQFPNMLGLDTSGMKVVDEMNLTAEDLANLREQFPNMLGLNLPQPRDISRWTGTGSLRNPDKWQDPDGAKAALRAAEMYAYGVSQGTISKNADTEAKLLASLQSYSEELKALGYDLSAGLFGIVDQIKNWAKTSFMSDADRKSLTKDHNVEVYTKLVSDMPKSREEFNALIKQIDLETEAGRLLYVELMKLVPAFDAMYDAIESFEVWLGVSKEVDLAKKRLTKIFEDAGMKLPGSKDELKELYESGKLTAEFMAILGASVEDLALVFDELENSLSLLDFAEILDPLHQVSKDDIKKAEDELRKYGYTGDIHDSEGLAEFFRMIKATDTEASNAAEDLEKFFNTNKEVFDALAAAAQQNADLQIRLATAKGDTAEALRLQREQELKTALDDTNRAILKEIYAHEDYKRALEAANAAMDSAYAALERAVGAERDRIEDAYQARIDAIEAEREALSEAHEARQKSIEDEREAINKQNEELQDALSKVDGILSSIQSALDSIRGEIKESEIAMDRARRQLHAWAVSNTLPEQDAFDRTMQSINKDDRNNYASELEYTAKQQGVYADLLAMEKNGLRQQSAAEKQLDAAEKQLEALDAQSKQLDEQYQAEMERLDEQAKVAGEWRDAELKVLDDILKDAKDAMDIARGIDISVKSIDQALLDFNADMRKYLELKSLGPTGSPQPQLAATDIDTFAETAAEQTAVISELKAEVAAMRKEMVAAGVSQAVTLRSVDDRMAKWDLDGSPPWRDDGTGQSATILKVA